MVQSAPRSLTTAGQFGKPQNLHVLRPTMLRWSSDRKHPQLLLWPIMSDSTRTGNSDPHVHLTTTQRRCRTGRFFRDVRTVQGSDTVVSFPKTEPTGIEAVLPLMANTSLSAPEESGRN